MTWSSMEERLVASGKIVVKIMFMGSLRETISLGLYWPNWGRVNNIPVPLKRGRRMLIMSLKRILPKDLSQALPAHEILSIPAWVAIGVRLHSWGAS